MPNEKPSNDNTLFPLHVFRFQVDFFHDGFDPKQKGDTNICSGAFSECSGLEATMEPKVINEGGRNFGAAQRPGPVTFSTVILKRGITSTQHLWQWFDLVAGQGKYSFRLAARIQMYSPSPPGSNESRTLAWSWRLAKAMPIKFKAPDLNAKGTDVGIEELHLAHEGIRFEAGGNN